MIDDEWNEWVKIYQQMSPANRQAMQHLIRWRLMRRRLLALKPHSTPHQARLPLLHAVLTFTFLALLPVHPMAMPTALGVSSLAMVYIHLLANGCGYHF